MADKPYNFARPAIGAWPCCGGAAARYDGLSKQAAQNGVCLDKFVFSTPMAMAGLKAYNIKRISMNTESRAAQHAR
jgi:hypothetical protein